MHSVTIQKTSTIHVTVSNALDARILITIIRRSLAVVAGLKKTNDHAEWTKSRTLKTK